jgi:thioredoxin-related protein
MKKFILFFSFLLLCTHTPAEARPAFTDSLSQGLADTVDIHWISIEEALNKMHQEPRKIYFDMYTDWCGWCKKMDASTFKNPNVVKYMNEKFYCIRFNAEQKDTLRFLTNVYCKYYWYDAASKSNTLAVELLHGKMSYPTAVFLEEGNFSELIFQGGIPVPGYQDIKSMEKILKYFGENIYKSKSWEDYDKSFIQYW